MLEIMNCIINAWQKYESEIRGYLINRLNDNEQAEELLQDVFLKAIRLGAKFCELENPRAWLYNVIKNEIIDQHRKEKVRATSSPCDDHTDEIEEALKVSTPVANLSQCLPLALQHLSSEDKHIISLCDIEGMKQSDYATQFELTLPAVKSKIQRARVHLKKRLKVQCKIIFDEQGKVCCFTPVHKEKNN